MRLQVKLGRKAVKRDSRTLMLKTYLRPQLPKPPAERDWTQGKSSGWGVMLNDTLGCCTIAGISHAVQVLTMNTGTVVTVPDSAILDYYEKWDGYVQGDPATDNGGVELDVLNNWRRSDFAGHKLLAYADANIRNETEVRQAINLFGGLYIGFQVPSFVMDLADDPTKVWDVQRANSDIEGGHCVFVAGYDATGNRKLISWGNVYQMTKAFWLKYVDEAHCLVSPDFIAKNGVSASGFALADLQSDLGSIV